MTAERFTSRLLLDRRRLLRTAFWATLAGGSAGALLSGGRYLWPPPPLRAGLVRVPANQVPGPGADPIRVPDQPFYLVHLSEGEGLPPRTSDVARPVSRATLGASSRYRD
ncbi:MAG: hypothetical protein ACRDJ9_12370, partial [Dehalococcoidia bacterium]